MLKPSAAKPGRKIFRPEDSYAVRTLANVTATPDGRLAVFVATQPDTVSNKGRSELWAWSAERGTFQVTFSGRAWAPRFSPRGDKLAYLSDRAGEKAQVFVMALGLSEGQPVTHFEQGASGFEWSPDGRRLAVLAKADKSPAQKKMETDKLDAWTYDQDEPRHQLWIVNVDGSGHPRRASSPLEHVASVAWFPDGRRMAYAAGPLAQLNSQWYYSELKTVALSGRGRRTVCRWRGAAVGARFSISRDGRQALVVESFSAAHFWHDTVKLVDLRTGRKTPVAAGLDRRTFAPQWLSDGRVLLECEDGTTVAIMVCQPGEKPRDIFRGPGVAAFAAPAEQAGRLFFIYSEGRQPDELHAAPLDGSGPPAQLTNLNRRVRALPLAAHQVFRWQSGGRAVEGMLYLPAGGGRGPRPLIVMPHGGPYGASLNSYTGANVPNIFCAAGYACFLPNFRGSTGYGRRFMSSNIGDWGDGPFADIMAGVDALVRRGVANGRRLAIFGGSYGGYMTAWAVGHTRRFRCAVAVAAVTNNHSMWGTTDIPNFMLLGGGEKRASFTGRFWREQSPLHYVRQVRTPTLVITGEVDLRVPPEQSHEFYRALKAEGVETKLVLYPREAHGVGEPRHRLHYFKMILNWINEHTLSGGKQGGGAAAK